jgi:hypothetical protein
VATFFSIFCVMPLFWGFWQLGRKVSLEPLEIARALRAPILANVKNRDAPIDDVMEEVGDRRVQYGRLVDETDPNLVIADPTKIRPVSTMGSPKPNRMSAIFEH